MGTLVLLVANEDPAAEAGPAVAQRLAALGVTSLSVLRDEQSTALTLQGWGFDPSRSAEAAVAVLTANRGGVRVLRPVLESEIHRPAISAERGAS